MTAVNHALTGAAIGLISGQPAIALPLALASHFICDAIPHFGSLNTSAAIRSSLFRNYLILEAGLCFLLVTLLAVTQPTHWLLAATCAFVAASPDFLWINRFRLERQRRTWQPNAFSRFAQDIQWFQRPIGGLVEVVWFASALAIIQPFI